MGLLILFYAALVISLYVGVFKVIGRYPSSFSSMTQEERRQYWSDMKFILIPAALVFLFCGLYSLTLL